MKKILFELFLGLILGGFVFAYLIAHTKTNDVKREEYIKQGKTINQADSIIKKDDDDLLFYLLLAS